MNLWQHLFCVMYAVTNGRYVHVIYKTSHVSGFKYNLFTLHLPFIVFENFMHWTVYIITFKPTLWLLWLRLRMLWLYFQVQTRSADESMTTFVLCHVCGNRCKVRLSNSQNQEKCILFLASNTGYSPFTCILLHLKTPRIKQVKLLLN